MVHLRERTVQRHGRPWPVRRALAVLGGLVCAAACALSGPRLGSGLWLWLLPLCVGAGFVWGHRAREAESREALDALKSRLAHDLNNPLAILIDHLNGAIGALERPSVPRGLGRPQEVKALADGALAAARRMAGVVRDLDDTAMASFERPTVALKSGPVPTPVRARILVIDDEPQVAASMRRMLYRHDVTVATTGYEAESLIRHHEFDVIVSDVMMPEPSGMDVFERLARTDPDLSRRFVFVTGGTYTDRARDFLAGIPNARLGKPVDPLALDRAIAAVHQRLELSAALK